MAERDREIEPRLEVHRIAWNWYRYRVVSPPDVDVMGQGTRRFVRSHVAQALRDADDPEHLRAHLEAALSASSERDQ